MQQLYQPVGISNNEHGTRKSEGEIFEAVPLSPKCSRSVAILECGSTDRAKNILYRQGRYTRACFLLSL